VPKANPRQWYGSGARDVQSENGAYRAPQPEPSVGGGAAPAGGEAAARGAAPAPAPREGRGGEGLEEELRFWAGPVVGRRDRVFIYSIILT